MRALQRRAALTAIAAAGAATLAALTLWRKPPSPPIATPVAPEPVSLRPFSTLTKRDPPRPPPAATFIDADGNPHHLEEFAGAGLVVNLWATWCTPCVAEMPALQDFSRIVQPANIRVLPISSDRGGAKVVRQFYAAHGITSLPVWLDPKAQAAEAWDARGLPTTLIIDRRGREVGRLEGAIDWAADATVAGVKTLVG